MYDSELLAAIYPFGLLPLSFLEDFTAYLTREPHPGCKAPTRLLTDHFFLQLLCRFVFSI